MPSDKSIRPRRENAESKAETTKRISEEMLQTEAEIRKAKTSRLRAARLAMQENQVETLLVKRRAAKSKPAAKPST